MIRLLVSSFFVLSLISCTTNKYMPKDGSIDKKFVGIWVGEDLDEKSGLKRSWTQTRKANGTYSISMIYEMKDKSIEKVEGGYWWIKDGKFYEIVPKVMTEPDVYKVEILNSKEIKFTNISVDETADIVIRENYTFIDRKK